MGTQDEIYAVLALEGGGFVGGADAAGEGDFFDAAFAAEAVELAEVAADAVDGVLAHVAGVEDDEVGFFVGLDLCVSGVQDHAPYPVGVVDVHLAAKGTDAGGPGPLGPGGRPGAARARLARDRDLCRDWRRFCGVTQSLPPARRCGPSPRSLPDGSRAEVPLSLGSSPAPPA